VSRFLTKIINDPPGKRAAGDLVPSRDNKEHTTVDNSAIAQKSIVATPTIVLKSTVDTKEGQLSSASIVDKVATVDRVSSVKGFTRVPNEILDSVLRTLSPIEQVLLLRLYRLSYGFKSETCCVGYGTLAKACNISSRQAQRSIERLVEMAWLERVGVEQGGSVRRERGSIYKLKLPIGTMDTVSTMDRQSTIDIASSNKEHTYKETHNTGSVRVGSRFSITECRRYAESLRNEGIANPGGYATKIHRSGEADELIAAFLAPAEAAPSVDVSQCPDCRGTGFWEPGGVGKGVAKCKHERLEPRQTHCT
jgi:hypothetical protein